MKKILVLTLSMVLLMVTSCRKKDPVVPVKTFVLVHGAWQAPWVWKNVALQLQARYNNVVIVELPGHGNDQTAPQSLTLEKYRDKVVAVINSLQGKVVLVGHSMAGMVISATAEVVPDKIERLIYIGAYVPANGQSLLALATVDSESKLGPNLLESADHLTLGVKQDMITAIFCQDAPDVIKAELLANYKVEAAIPFTNPLSLSTAKYGSVPKSYIFTLLDNVIGMKLQQQMVTAAGISDTRNINTGHSPFLSRPSETANLFLDIIRQR